MSLENRGYSMLLVSSDKAFVTALTPLLPESMCNNIKTASDISTAKRLQTQIDFDFIIINFPYSEDAIQFAVDAGDLKNSVVLYMARSEFYEDMNSRLSAFGVFTIAVPTNRYTMTSALNWMISAREKLRKLETRTMSVQRKMEEIRIVNRAKWLLISKLNYSEPQAHRYIEKEAMDQCVSRRQIAEDIIKNYS